MDDGSPDGSGTICDDYAAKDDRVKVIHRKNGGVSSARNAGIAFARGEYIGFVDSDDYVEKSMYEVMYHIAESKNVDVVNCGYFYESIKKVEQLNSGFRKNMVLHHIDMVEAAQHPENGLQDFWFSCRNIYSRRLLGDHALFFNTFTKYGEDVNFNLQAFLFARTFYSTDQHLYHYVENPNSVSRTKCKESYLEHLSLTYLRRVEIYEQFNLDSVNCLRGLKTRVCEIFLMELLLNVMESTKRRFCTGTYRDSQQQNDGRMFHRL